MERKNQCPHCRLPLKLSQIVNIKFINELSNVKLKFILDPGQHKFKESKRK